MDRQIESLFRAEDKICVDPERKKETVSKVRELVKEQSFCSPPSFWRSLLGQLRYMQTGCLVGQSVCVGAMLSAILYFKLSPPQPRYSYLAVFNAFFSFVGVFLMVELGRNFSRNTWELEQSCFYDLKQVCASRLLFYGGMDLFLLLFFAGLAKDGAGIGFLRLCLYTMTSFVFSQCVYLYVFFFFRPAEKEYVQYGAALLTGFLSVFLTAVPRVYEREGLWAWGLALAVLLVVFGQALRKLFKGMEGEELCWNSN